MSFKAWKRIVRTAKKITATAADVVDFTPGPKGREARAAARALAPRTSIAELLLGLAGGALAFGIGAAIAGAAARSYASAIAARCSCDDALLLTFGCSCKSKGAVLASTRPPAEKSEVSVTFEEVSP